MLTPLILRLHDWIGDARFRQLRGQAIALHAQAIQSFCRQFHLTPTCRQQLLRTAHSNGQRLGLLA